MGNTNDLIAAWRFQRHCLRVQMRRVLALADELAQPTPRDRDESEKH